MLHIANRLINLSDKGHTISDKGVAIIYSSIKISAVVRPVEGSIESEVIEEALKIGSVG